MKNNRIPAIIIAVITILLSLVSCAGDSVPNAPEMAYYGNFEQMKNDTPFDFYIPTDLPSGFIQTAAWKFSKDEVYITYTNGTRDLLFAAVKGGDANTDPENIFNQITEKKISDFSVKFLERFDFPECINLTKFKIGKINYAIDSVTPEEAEIIISSMKAISSVSDFTSAIGGTPEKFDSLSALSTAFGTDIPFPDSITPSSFEILSGIVAQVKFEYAGEPYTYAVSNGTASKDLYRYKTNNNSYDYRPVENYELFIEMYGSRGETEDETILCTTSWASEETMDAVWYTLFSESGSSPEDMLGLAMQFHATTAPERVDIVEIDPTPEEPTEETAE